MHETRIQPEPQPNPAPHTNPHAQLDQDTQTAVVIDYLTADTPLAQLALDHNIPLPALLDLIESEDIAALLDRLERAAQRRARLAAADRAHAATLALDRVLMAPAATIETQRRAATTLLRHSPKPAPTSTPP
ncbi:MAG: hypothetical protein AAFY58_09550, partial [Planctomycetota bacterium]